MFKFFYFCFVKQRLFYFFIGIKLSYYWLNRQESLQKAEGKYHNCGGKEKAAKYYHNNKYVTKEKAKNKYKNLTKKEKEAKRQYSKNRYNKMKEKSS